MSCSPIRIQNRCGQMAVCNYGRGEPPGRLTIFGDGPSPISPTPHFCWPVWTPSRRTYRQGLGPARPSPIPHFYRRALGLPGFPEPLTFIDRPWASLVLPNTSLVSTGPRPAWPWPTPLPLANPSLLLARPDPSFLLAGLGQVRVRRGGQGRLTNPILTLAPRRA